MRKEVFEFKREIFDHFMMFKAISLVFMTYSALSLIWNTGDLKYLRDLKTQAIISLTLVIYFFARRNFNYFHMFVILNIISLFKLNYEFVTSHSQMERIVGPLVIQLSYQHTIQLTAFTSVFKGTLLVLYLLSLCFACIPHVGENILNEDLRFLAVYMLIFYINYTQQQR
jgi:hypothetical protein